MVGPRYCTCSLGGDIRLSGFHIQIRDEGKVGIIVRRMDLSHLIAASGSGKDKDLPWLWQVDGWHAYRHPHRHCNLGRMTELWINELLNIGVTILLLQIMGHDIGQNTRMSSSLSCCIAFMNPSSLYYLL